MSDKDEVFLAGNGRFRRRRTVTPDDDTVLIGCFTIEELPDPDPPERMTTCEACDTEVWVSSRTLARAADERPGLLVHIFCWDCLTSVLDTSENETRWELTAEQEWMRPLLPPHRLDGLLQDGE